VDRFRGPVLAPLDAEYDIGLVLAFLNTCDAKAGDDLLHDPEQWRAWCAERSLGTPADRDAARGIRDAMRSAVMCGKSVPLAAPRNWPMQVRLNGGVPILAGTDAVGAVLTAAVHLVTTGQWDRIKICPAADCLWAFYDRSRNRSRTWCSMSVCGNREKARSWRERHATTNAG
jgi:hypothetical protein